MDNWFQRFLLVAGCSFFSQLTWADTAEQHEQVSDQVIIKPNLERREISEDRLDNENWAVGMQVGMLNIEDFGSNTWLSANVSYHLSEYFYIKAEYGHAKGGETSFEKLAIVEPLMTEDERNFDHMGLNIGYNFLPGEVFIGKGMAFNSAFSFELGAGTTEFAGDDQFTVNLGANYRVFLTDWLAWDIAMKDHILDVSITGETKTTHNMNFSLGLAAYF